MRTVLFLLIFLLSSCHQQRDPASQSLGQHVVFDLDWTLISENLSDVRIPQSSLVEHENVIYKVHDGVAEMITDLVNNYQVNISFFSGGGVERNQHVLKQIKLTDGSGRSLFDIAYKVLSRPDLTDLSHKVAADAKFSERYKKDLLKVSSDLDNIVIIEDNYWFAADKSQRRNFIWLGPSYKHYENFKQVKRRIGMKGLDEYLPNNFEEWSVHRNKIAVVHGMLSEALESDQDLTDAMREIADEVKLEENNWSPTKMRRLIRAKNRGSITRIPLNNSCDGLLFLLLLLR